jgi:DNA-binding XRE family transcriptional regulator
VNQHGRSRVSGAGGENVATVMRRRRVGGAEAAVGAAGAPARVAPLAERRRRVPWTQRELAAAAGVSVGTVRGIEQGLRRAPHPRVVRALAAVLGVPPAAVAEFRLVLGICPAG